MNLGFNSKIFFLVGPQFGPWIGPKSGWAKWDPQGLVGRVWAPHKKTRLLNGRGPGNGSRPVGWVWVRV